MAHVYDGVENERNAGWYNGARTIYLAIQRQPGTNTVEVVDRIKALLPQLEQQLPASVQLRIRSDRVGADPRVGGRREVHAAAHRRAWSSW